MAPAVAGKRIRAERGCRAEFRVAATRMLDRYDLQRMRNLIIGEGKSGTTALLRSVASTMGSPVEVFEPTDLSAVDLTPDNLVVKKLLHTWETADIELLERFDRVVFLVRDPRDRIISHMLYDAYNRADELTDEQRERWLGVLERKSQAPLDFPYVRMIDIWWQITRAGLLHVYMNTAIASTSSDTKT